MTVALTVSFKLISFICTAILLTEQTAVRLELLLIDLLWTAVTVVQKHYWSSLL